MDGWMAVAVAAGCRRWRLLAQAGWLAGLTGWLAPLASWLAGWAGWLTGLTLLAGWLAPLAGWLRSGFLMFVCFAIVHVQQNVFSDFYVFSLISIYPL